MWYIGSAAVSKTALWGFDSLHPCHFVCWGSGRCAHNKVRILESPQTTDNLFDQQSGL